MNYFRTEVRNDKILLRKPKAFMIGVIINLEKKKKQPSDH